MTVNPADPGDRVVEVRVLVSIPAAGDGGFTFDELVSEVVGEVEHGIQNTRLSYTHLAAYPVCPRCGRAGCQTPPAGREGADEPSQFSSQTDD